MKNKKIKLNTTIAKDLLKLGLISKKILSYFIIKLETRKLMFIKTRGQK